MIYLNENGTFGTLGIVYILVSGCSVENCSNQGSTHPFLLSCFQNMDNIVQNIFASKRDLSVCL